MRFRNGLTVGGPIFRHHVAHSICIPLLSMHRPDKTCWSWLVEFFRYRRSSGCRHYFFRIRRQRGSQSFIEIDLLWLGSLQFVTQIDWDEIAAERKRIREPVRT